MTPIPTPKPDLGPQLQELQEALAAAAKEASYFTAFFQICPLPCAIFYKKHIAYVNEAFCRALKRPCGELVGKTYADIVCTDCETISHMEERWRWAGDDGGQFEPVTYHTGDGRRVKFYATWRGDGIGDVAYAVYVPASAAKDIIV